MTLFQSLTIPMALLTLNGCAIVTTNPPAPPPNAPPVTVEVDAAVGAGPGVAPTIERSGQGSSDDGTATRNRPFGADVRVPR